MEAKRKRKNKLLFTRDSECLQELKEQIQVQNHRTIVKFAKLFNVKYSIVFVTIVLGNLLLFEYLRLDLVMFDEMRFLIAGAFAYPIWHFYGKKILTNEVEMQSN